MMTSEKILMTLPGGAVIEGDFIATRITPETPGLIGLHGVTGMAHAETLEHDEIIDIVEAGTCLVEDPNGSRWLIRISSGTMRGPLRVLEVEDVRQEVIEAAAEPERRARRSAQRVDQVNAVLAFTLALQSAWLAPRLFESFVLFGLLAVLTSLAMAGLTIHLLFSEKLMQNGKSSPPRSAEPPLSRAVA